MTATGLKHIFDGKEYVLWKDIQPALIAAGKIVIVLGPFLKMDHACLQELKDAVDNYDREIFALMDK